MIYALPVLGAMIGFLFWAYTGEVETRVKYQVAAETAQIASDYKDETARLSQENADFKAKADAGLVTAQNEYSQQINAMRSSYETKLRNQPFDTGNAFELRLARLMCKISSDSADSRQACDIPLAEAYSPDTALVVTVTAETTQQWAEQCEDGLTDYCDYAIVGLTTQGGLTLLDYMNQVDRYIQQWKNLNDYDNKIIDALKE